MIDWLMTPNYFSNSKPRRFTIENENAPSYHLEQKKEKTLIMIMSAGGEEIINMLTVTDIWLIRVKNISKINDIISRWSWIKIKDIMEMEKEITDTSHAPLIKINLLIKEINYLLV